MQDRYKKRFRWLGDMAVPYAITIVLLWNDLARYFHHGALDGLARVGLLMVCAALGVLPLMGLNAALTYMNNLLDKLDDPDEQLWKAVLWTFLLAFAIVVLGIKDR